VDSKWPAERELLALTEARDPVERERLIRAIERTVAERAREVAGYRDAAVTAPVGVVAVPDAAYAVLRRAHSEAYRQGVVVIAYSMALPVVLFLHSIVARFGSVGDVRACLQDLSSILDTVESTLENKVARASTMLTNGAEELRGQMGKARSTLARARDPSPGLEGNALAELDDGETGVNLVALQP
jgi:DNA recombination protein RmuC